MSETITLQAGQKIRTKQTGQVYTVENFWPKMHPPITVVESDRMFDLREVEVVEQSPTEPRAGESQRFKVGQRVYWNDPDAGLCSGFGEIASIRGDGDPDGLEDQIFTLQMDSGGETETVMSELSEVAPTNPRAQTATLAERLARLIYAVEQEDDDLYDQTYDEITNQHTKLVAALRVMRAEFNQHTCKHHGAMVCDKCEALTAARRSTC